MKTLNDLGIDYQPTEKNISDLGIFPLNHQSAEVITDEQSIPILNKSINLIGGELFYIDLYYFEPYINTLFASLLERLGQHIRVKDNIVLRFGSDDNMKFNTFRNAIETNLIRSKAESFFNVFKYQKMTSIIGLPLFYQKNRQFIPLTEIANQQHLTVENLLIKLDISKNDVINAINICFKEPFIESTSEDVESIIDDRSSATTRLLAIADPDFKG